ncbi:MAG: GGDEF domain-containing protein, partial [Clostridia bacterium]|nr:GGDEF domain-containing protein [Clostridia bacterium]
DFFKNVVRDVSKAVYEEDRELLMNFMQKDRLLRTLQNGSMQSVAYRLMIDGKPVYHTMRLIHNVRGEEDFFVFGVLNIDEQVIKDKNMKAVEKSRVIFSQIAESLADHYATIYYVDMQTEHYVELASENIYKSLNIPETGMNFFDEAEKNAARVVHEEDRAGFLAVVNKQAMLHALNENVTLTTTYRLLMDGTEKYARLTAIWANDKRHVIIGVENVDEEIKREKRRKELEEKSITYNQIAISLATRYDSIYYIDMETHHYTEYVAPEVNKNMEIKNKGEDFFIDCVRDIEQVIFSEDRELMLESMKKENIIKTMKGSDAFSFTYRKLINDSPTYMKLRMVRANDKRHLILGVANVDSQIRKEREYVKALRYATEKAERDALTGVKNKTAYQDIENEIQTAIENGTQGPFAVVVCDINGLKDINDTYGHKAGDAHICSACELICYIYAHSPVFRIGGDEFSVILRGRDYVYRDSLLAKIRKEVTIHQSEGKVVVATGMGVYQPGKDKHFFKVFDRADARMYDNKKALKGAQETQE